MLEPPRFIARPPKPPPGVNDKSRFAAVIGMSTDHRPVVGLKEFALVFPLSLSVAFVNVAVAAPAVASYQRRAVPTVSSVPGPHTCEEPDADTDPEKPLTPPTCNFVAPAPMYM